MCDARVAGLAELRRARHLTQEDLAARVGLRQNSVSRIERQTDWHVSTLAKVVVGLGGALVLVARFDDADYQVTMPDADGG